MGLNTPARLLCLYLISIFFVCVCVLSNEYIASELMKPHPCTLYPPCCYPLANVLHPRQRRCAMWNSSNLQLIKCKYSAQCVYTVNRYRLISCRSLDRWGGYVSDWCWLACFTFGFWFEKKNELFADFVRFIIAIVSNNSFIVFLTWFIINYFFYDFGIIISYDQQAWLD